MTAARAVAAVAASIAAVWAALGAALFVYWLRHVDAAQFPWLT